MSLHQTSLNSRDHDEKTARGLFAEALHETSELDSAITRLEEAANDFAIPEAEDGEARFRHGRARVLDSLAGLFVDLGDQQMQSIEPGLRKLPRHLLIKLNTPVSFLLNTPLRFAIARNSNLRGNKSPQHRAPCKMHFTVRLPLVCYRPIHNARRTLPYRCNSRRSRLANLFGMHPAKISGSD